MAIAAFGGCVPRGSRGDSSEHVCERERERERESIITILKFHNNVIINNLNHLHVCSTKSFLIHSLLNYKHVLFDLQYN